ncbi:NAD(P)/FAD-dependent oxidoreductase [Flammeovirga pectinis]|uniref:NAD(P)/FAD-dependent oxidoreductase n=1 Tax=Flammeovirga pectinis TaxID=2494373 RepID=A0A3Q9FMJ3_9BACT|nr:ArsO family NAD(P)H-dependent flavin-containing monooxygenase [Flammeovirga pectinis]AZQ61685.1 NAD(P)/FAD-dependent oxidoreductase [Flammeovirga pectinis]
MKIYDVIIIGSGQAGLSVAYFLNKHNLDYLILDNNTKAGGSWLKVWDSLKLFSPGIYSSLSGWMIRPPKEEYPNKNEFITYMSNYEKRYDFPIKRPVNVTSVTHDGEYYHIETDGEKYISRTVIGSTGTAANPKIPKFEGVENFKGEQLHSINYRNPKQLKGKKVLIIGGGNSGAQIVSELSKTNKVQWATFTPLTFLPDDVDGRYLFNNATQKYRSLLKGELKKEEYSLADIVMIDSVKNARARGVLHARRSTFTFKSDGVVWEDGTSETFDAVIWCTGFKANLSFLSDLNIVENGEVKTNGTRVENLKGLWLVGYGNWTGFASATIYGVGKTAKNTVEEVIEYLINLKFG